MPASLSGRILVLAAKRFQVRGMACLALIPYKLVVVDVMLARVAFSHF